MPTETAQPNDEREQAEVPGDGSSGRVLRSEELFAGTRAIVIQHASTRYRLLITRNDRLILQK